MWLYNVWRSKKVWGHVLAHGHLTSIWGQWSQKSIKIKSPLHSHIYTQIFGKFMLIANIYILCHKNSIWRKYDVIWGQRSQRLIRNKSSLYGHVYTQIFKNFTLITNIYVYRLNIFSEVFVKRQIFKILDDLRYSMHHKTSFKLDLEKMPPRLSSIHLLIQRAYLQCQLWVNAVSKQLTLDPCDYGYKKVDNMLFPIVTLTNKPLPVDFPKPCKCLKCARPTICPCRKLNMTCCEFCNCGTECKNPMK